MDAQNYYITVKRYPRFYYEPAYVCDVSGGIKQVGNGYATGKDVDRACRNNAGYRMTVVGVFTWMDLTGVPA